MQKNWADDIGPKYSFYDLIWASPITMHYLYGKIALPLLLLIVVLGSIATSGNTCASSLEITAAKKFHGNIVAFQEFTAISPGQGISLSVHAIEVGNLTASYLFNGKTTEIFSKEIKAGQQIFIPASDKFIFLSNPGLHKFSISFTAQSGVFRDDLTVLVEDSQKPDLAKIVFGLKKIEGSEVEETLYRFPETNVRELESGPSELRIAKTRGKATRLYKNLASSVVLVIAGKSMGTGSVISKDGEILTNWHVVNNKTPVAIIFKPGKFAEIKQAEKHLADVIKVDEEKDLAIVKLRNPPNALKPIKFGTQDDVEVAMDVHAIGHPKGNFWTYTRGVLSQIRPNFRWSTSQGVKHIADIIQTQTPINPGNSGGPLINDDQKIIGVNSFIDNKAQGLNYAVAITSVKKFLRSRRGFKKASRINTKNKPSKGLRVDLDKDGRKESTVYDKNGNGKPERILIDKDGDGKVDVILKDKNENGIIEMKIRFLTVKGRKVAVIAFDRNEDGKVELIGYDFDRDGKIDKYEKV